MGTYHDSHLVVAAVRILETKRQHPPTVDEISDLLEWHPDRIGVLLRSLEELGAIRALTSPFETRYEVEDHLTLETIDQDEKGPGFADELAEFAAKSEAEKERLEKLFADSEEAKEKKLRSLDDDFARFKKGKPRDPFS